MKACFRLAIIALVVIFAAASVRAKEQRTVFKKAPANGRIYFAPPGFRGADSHGRRVTAAPVPVPESPGFAAHPGWPKTFSYYDLGYGLGHPGPARLIASDLDGDGKKEITFTADYWNQVLVFKENGSVFNSMPLPNAQGETLSMGDLFNNSKNEIVTLSYKNGGKLFLYVMNWLGELLFDRSLLPNNVEFMPIVADLDADGRDEIIIKTGKDARETSIKIILGNNQVVHEWLTRNVQNCFSFTSVNPAIGNFDADADLEIIVPLWHWDAAQDQQATFFEAYDMDGTAVPGWEHVAYPDYVYNPVCADLDGDGRDEIIACTSDGPLLIYSSDGRLLLEKGFAGGMGLGSPAIGDINHDGKREIVLQLFNHEQPTSLLAIDAQGEIILRKTVSGGSDFSPLIGDMDGDGFADIVCGTPDHIYAFDWQGNDVAGFPIPVNAQYIFVSCGPGQSICDVDHDGKIELLYTVDHGDDYEFSLHVLDIDSPYDATTMEWPMHQHDAGHSGRYVSPFPDLVSLNLAVERREARSFSIVRQYGQIEFTVGDPEVPVAEFRVMRRKGNAKLELLQMVTPSALQGNRCQVQDKYLEKDVAYTYRVDAYDAGGQLIGRSAAKTI